MDNRITHPTDYGKDDNRPLPLVVAERWGFSLATVQDDNKMWYSIRDWIAALTSSKDPMRAWQTARKAPEMQSVLAQVRYFPYGNGESQFVDDKGLYRIAVNLRTSKNRTALPEIKDYLAKAGAFVDLVRRDEYLRAEIGATAGAEAVIDATIARYKKGGRDEGWIQARLQGVVTRNQFTSALKLAILNASPDLYRDSTEKIYAGLWKRTTEELRTELNLKKNDKTRDHFGEYALIYTRLAEKIATDKLKNAEVVYEQLGMEIVYDAAKLIHVQAEATAQALGIDLVTEKPLLKTGSDITREDFHKALAKVSHPIKNQRE